jgi:hypothetical protein
MLPRDAEEILMVADEQLANGMLPGYSLQPTTYSESGISIVTSVDRDVAKTPIPLLRT